MIGVLIVTWNRIADLRECLRSVMQSDYRGISVYVVDNASSDGTSVMVAQEFPTARLVCAKENLGFAAGNNLGLSLMLRDGVDAVLMLNDDTVVAEDAISALVAGGFHDPSVGVLASKVLFHSDPETIWSAGGAVDLRTGVAVQRLHGEQDDAQTDEPVEVQYAVGCAMLVKADVIRKVGLFDTDYYMYYEEADWCRRIREAGYKVIYVPRSRVRHKVGVSRNTSNHVIYYFARNRLLYMRKSGVHRVRIAWVAVSGIWRSALGHAAHARIRESRLMLRGVADYYGNRFGKFEEGI